MKKAVLLVLTAAMMIIPGNVTLYETELAAQINEHINLEPHRYQRIGLCSKT